MDYYSKAPDGPVKQSRRHGRYGMVSYMSKGVSYVFQTLNVGSVDKWGSKLWPAKEACREMITTA